MIELSNEQIEIYKMDDEGRAYLKYNELVGGEPFGYCIGCPDIDSMYGGIVGLYQECIKQKKTWQELIGSGWDELQEND